MSRENPFRPVTEERISFPLGVTFPQNFKLTLLWAPGLSNLAIWSLPSGVRFMHMLTGIPFAERLVGKPGVELSFAIIFSVHLVGFVSADQESSQYIPISWGAPPSAGIRAMFSPFGYLTDQSCIHDNVMDFVAPGIFHLVFLLKR